MFFVAFINLPFFFINCANTYAYIPRAIGAVVTLESSGIELCFCLEGNRCTSGPSFEFMALYVAACVH